MKAFYIQLTAAILGGFFLLGVSLYKIGWCTLTIWLAAFLAVLFVIFAVNLKK